MKKSRLESENISMNERAPQPVHYTRIPTNVVEESVLCMFSDRGETNCAALEVGYVGLVYGEW